MKGQFTAEAEKAINRAAKYAVRLGNTVLGTEHILYGLSAAPGVASRIGSRENGLRQSRDGAYSDGDSERTELYGISCSGNGEP